MNVKEAAEVVRERLAHAAEADVRVAEEGETIVLEGEAPTITAKKRQRRRAEAVAPGVTVVDRVRVETAGPAPDEEILDGLCRRLLGERALREHAMLKVVDGNPEPVYVPPRDQQGRIECTVEDGMIRLRGEAAGLEFLRLAGVLAWWVPRARDVVVDLEVRPEEEDGDDLLRESVRTALEKDPFVDAREMRLRVSDRVVTLEGVVSSEKQCRMAEDDAWAVEGVRGVTNRLSLAA